MSTQWMPPSNASHQLKKALLSNLIAQKMLTKAFAKLVFYDAIRAAG
jgi:hypothetical protein